MIIHRLSLRTRFLLFAAACLIPFAVVIGFLLNGAENQNAETVTANQRTIANVVGTSLTDYLNGNVIALNNLSKTESIATLDPIESPGVLGQAVLARPELGTLLVVNRRLQMVGTTDQSERDLVAMLGSQLNETLLARTPKVSSRARLTNGMSVIVITAPIVTSNNTTGTGSPNPAIDADVTSSGPVSPQTTTDDTMPPGSVVGVIASVIRIDTLQRAIIPTSFGSSMIGVVGSGEIAIGTENVWQDQGAFLARFQDEIALTVSGDEGTINNTSRDEIGAFLPVTILGMPWSVIVSTTHATDWWKIGWSSALALGLAIVFVGALALAVGELTARPLRTLAAKAAALRHGEPSPMMPMGSGEIRTLSTAMADMSVQIQSQFERLGASRTERGHQAEQMRDLLRRTMRLQEDERRRIASDIHDAVSPLITGALYQARALQRDERNVSAVELEEALASVNHLLERASEELHEVIFDLRPPDLDDIGVVAAIEAFVHAIQKTGLNCQLEVITEPPPLPPEVRLGVYRIVQEALHNVLRHASADEAVVRIELLSRSLRVTIRDNGTGFDPETAIRPTSLGLLSMRERAAGIGATLNVISRAGGGTAVVLERPNTEDVMSIDVLEQMTEGDHNELNPVRELHSGNGATGLARIEHRSPETATGRPGGGTIW